jgi:hypothetical protein
MKGTAGELKVVNKSEKETVRLKRCKHHFEEVKNDRQLDYTISPTIFNIFSMGSIKNAHLHPTGLSPVFFISMISSSFFF